MPTKIAINGFGRIGRAAFKIALEKKDAEIVAINDLSSVENLAYLLKYDTAYGVYDKEISFEDNSIIVDGKKFRIYAEPDPKNLPWKELAVDVVLECTGRFVKDGTASVHLEAGAKKVVLSAPAKGEGSVPTFLIGANHDQYLGQNLVSNASCTTNCISPVISVLHSNFKVLKSVMTTVHAVTSTQSIVDSAVKGADFRKGRAGPFNIIPTSTGAAVAATKAIPDLENKFDGISLRVPVAVGSVSDITVVLEKKTSVEEVNQSFLDALKNPFYSTVLHATYDQIVSSDIVGSPFSAIVDLSMTRVVDGDLVKVLAWYDNEWGYSNRLVEMALLTS